MMLLQRLLVTVAVVAMAGNAPAQMARDQALEIAHDCAKLQWNLVSSNIYTGIADATCPYSTPGPQTGISYKWGGFDTRDSFYLNVVTNGGYAGDVNSAAIVSGTYGQDCSGFMSRAFKASRFTTSSYPSISTLMTYANIAPGDVTNDAGSHMRMFERYTSTNVMMLIECTAGVSPGRVVRRTLATNTGYEPRRYNSMVAWPSLVAARAGATAGTAVLEWAGSATTGFRVYQSLNGTTWNLIESESTLGALSIGTTVAGLADNQLYYFRVTAVNGSTETAPSTVLCVRRSGTQPRALIVNGYDRWIRKSQSSGNPHAFVPRFAEPLAAQNFRIDSIDNLRITDGSVAMTDYAHVWWMLGDESTSDETFNHQEQLRVQTYLESGGKLFVSGAEILYDLNTSVNTINDVNFRTNYLVSGYAGDGSAGNGYGFSGIGGTAFASSVGTFDNGTQGTYAVTFPDKLTAQGGSVAVLNYSGGGTAATLLRKNFGTSSTPGALLLMGFPLETVTDAPARQSLVSASVISLTAAAAVANWADYSPAPDQRP